MYTYVGRCDNAGRFQEFVGRLAPRRPKYPGRKGSLVAKRRGKKAPLGSGARFAAIEKKAAASGAENPAAVAAAAGIAKYGQKKMTQLAVTGRKRAVKRRRG